MNQIAAEAQIGAGTLYRRYRNKSELCMDLLQDSKVLFFEDIDVYLIEEASRPPAERLRGLLALFIRFKEKIPNYLQVSRIPPPPQELFPEPEAPYITNYMRC
jgi:AcrR family transcriptional regulator